MGAGCIALKDEHNSKLNNRTRTYPIEFETEY